MSESAAPAGPSTSEAVEELLRQLVAERAAAIDGFPESKLHAISHCILAHHGPDALPGRQFRSPEALALYRLNALDAGVKNALEHGLA